MSFTTEVKNEICKLEFPLLENISELSAFARNNSKFNNDEIELVTENERVAERISRLINNIYGINPTLTEENFANFVSKKIFKIRIKNKVEEILRDLSLKDEDGNYIESPREYIIGSTEESKAYIRGAFLAKGSINDPKTSMYHLEFGFDNKYEAIFLQRLLNSFDMNSKIIDRDIKYMVYIKEAEKISDFLKLISAIKSVLYYEDIRVYKEQMNKTNRLNNCEQANTDKIFQTAQNQISDIEIIKEKMGLDLLDEKLKETCIYRLKYPEVSLTELGEIMTQETGKSVTKSGINHRFRKIKEIANRLKELENKNNM